MRGLIWQTLSLLISSKDSAWCKRKERPFEHIRNRKGKKWLTCQSSHSSLIKPIGSPFRTQEYVTVETHVIIHSIHLVQKPSFISQKLSVYTVISFTHVQLKEKVLFLTNLDIFKCMNKLMSHWNIIGFSYRFCKIQTSNWSN